MRVVITGAAGFIGQTLTAALLDAGRLRSLRGGGSSVDELVLVDRAFEANDISIDRRSDVLVRRMPGNLADAAFVQEIVDARPDSIFHLAAALTLDAEKESTEAYAVNVEAIRGLIAGVSAATRFVFASSIAVFGGDIPPLVNDNERFSPQTTYGAHKAIAELLLSDATRKGRIDARILRLPIVLIRKGANTPAVSDRIAAIVREPLAGRDVTCGLSPSTTMPVASAAAVASALIKLHDVAEDSLPMSRAMNLPSLSVSVEEMVSATLRQRVESTLLGRVKFNHDEQLQAIVDGWPRAFVSETATRLGISADGSFDDVIRGYLAEEAGGAVRSSLAE